MQNVYRLPVSETIYDAWSRIVGTKAAIWGGILVIVLIQIAFYIVSYILGHIFPALGSVVKMIGQLVYMLLTIGLLNIGIKRAFDLPVNYRLMFRSLETPILLRIIGVYVLHFLILLIPALILFALPLAFQELAITSPETAKLLTAICYIIGTFAFIYLIVRMSLAMALVLDKGIGSWEAIKQSFRGTRGNFWPLVITYIVSMFIFVISALPLFIGLIWTLPFLHILYGIYYKKLYVNIMAP